jgi:hypothetical protein
VLSIPILLSSISFLASSDSSLLDEDVAAVGAWGTTPSLVDAIVIDGAPPFIKELTETVLSVCDETLPFPAPPTVDLASPLTAGRALSVSVEVADSWGLAISDVDDDGEVSSPCCEGASTTGVEATWPPEDEET